jgi:opacity protein-like surface antigen
LTRTQLVGTPVGGTAEPGDEDGQYVTRLGWTLGLGVELRLSQNWSATFEYLYADFGSRNALFPLAAQQCDSD